VSEKQSLELYPIFLCERGLVIQIQVNPSPILLRENPVDTTMDANILALMTMGFEFEDAKSALMKAANDIDRAANILLEKP